jgi:hypothetical protein
MGSLVGTLGPIAQPGLNLTRAQHYANQISSIPRAELLHDSCTMDFDSALADTEVNAGLLVRRPACDTSGDLALTRRQTFTAWKPEGEDFGCLAFAR